MRELAVALGLIIALAESMIVYPQTLIVDTVREIDPTTYEVSLHSAPGFTYTTFTETDDLVPGETVAAIMFNSNTPDDVRDDRILTMRPTGFYKKLESRCDELIQF